jgi:hypothetical protein
MATPPRSFKECVDVTAGENLHVHKKQVSGLINREEEQPVPIKPLSDTHDLNPFKGK